MNYERTPGQQWLDSLNSSSFNDFSIFLNPLKQWIEAVHRDQQDPSYAHVREFSLDWAVAIRSYLIQFTPHVWDAKMEQSILKEIESFPVISEMDASNRAQWMELWHQSFTFSLAFQNAQSICAMEIGQALISHERHDHLKQLEEKKRGLKKLQEALGLPLDGTGVLQSTHWPPELPELLESCSDATHVFEWALFESEWDRKSNPLGLNKPCSIDPQRWFRKLQNVKIHFSNYERGQSEAFLECVAHPQGYAYMPETVRRLCLEDLCEELFLTAMSLRSNQKPSSDLESFIVHHWTFASSYFHKQKQKALWFLEQPLPELHLSPKASIQYWTQLEESWLFMTQDHAHSLSSNFLHKKQLT